jgi:threonine synthase
MRLRSLRDPTEEVSFAEAAIRGSAAHGGLFMPVGWPRLERLDDLLGLGFGERSARVLRTLLGDELPGEVLDRLAAAAFDFPVPVVPLAADLGVLELFHGPTLAFKDFGARFLARVLGHLVAAGQAPERLTVLTATSGDTGAAVAHAFHGVPGVDVVVLFPAGRISTLQERLLTALGGNVRSFAVAGAFDDCQRLAKACFDDADLSARLGLTSANSINVARLLAQVLYYLEAAAQVRGRPLIVAVPSGNFGNLTAGLLARALGAPLEAFVVATNANDVVPRYLDTGRWEPRPTVATLSNAMDVGAPNNWPRVEALLGDLDPMRAVLRPVRVDDAATRAAMRELHGLGYVADPHTAVAYRALRDRLRPGEHGVVLSTAHPAKFRDLVEETLGIEVPLPPALARVAELPSGAVPLANDLEALKALLLG